MNTSKCNYCKRENKGKSCWLFSLASAGFERGFKAFYQSKVNLYEKSLFDKITHHVDPEIRKILFKEHVRKPEFHMPFWSMIYLLLK